MKLSHVILIPVDCDSTPRGPPKINLPNSMTGIGQKSRGVSRARHFSFPNHGLSHEGRLGSFRPGPKRCKGSLLRIRLPGCSASAVSSPQPWIFSSAGYEDRRIRPQFYRAFAVTTNYEMPASSEGAVPFINGDRLGGC